MLKQVPLNDMEMQNDKEKGGTYANTTADNAVAYGHAGADILVSSSPYHAPPRDVEVRFSRDV